jgi:UPF0716 protein FxsA
MLPLFLLFVALPIAEIMLLINVSGNIGGLNTFFIVLITAAFGAYFVRQQGFSLLQQVQTKLNSGQAPNTELAEALLLLIAGVLLITPGFITDALGLLFTLPFSRGPIAAFLLNKVVLKHASHVNFGHGGFNQTPPNQPFDNKDPSGFNTSRHNSNNSNGNKANANQGEIIDGEYTDKSDKDDKNRLN